MPVRVITTEMSEQMKIMGKTMTVKQIADALKINYRTAHTHMNELEMGRKLGRSPRIQAPRVREKNREGFFNVNSKDNWLI